MDAAAVDDDWAIVELVEMSRRARSLVVDFMMDALRGLRRLGDGRWG